MRIRLSLNKKSLRKKTKGAALITALFITALVAAAAVFMALQQTISIRRTQTMLETDQAYLYTQAVNYWAMGMLKNNVLTSGDKFVAESLPKLFPEIKRNQSTITGTVDDMQGKLNLNNLVHKNFAKKFEKLIKNVEPQIKDELAHDITQAARHWVSKSNETTKISATDFDDYYLKQNPPYRASHYPMASPSELRLVAGMTADLYRKLEPFITALPASTAINVNTVSAEVLSAVSDLSIKDAESVIKDRVQGLFQTTEDFMKNSKIASAKLNIKEITIISQYFLVTATVRNPHDTLTAFSLIKREVSVLDEKKSAKLMILWTSHGAW